MGAPSQEGDTELARAWRLQEGFLQEGTSELGHLTLHSQWEEGPWLAGEASYVS